MVGNGRVLCFDCGDGYINLHMWWSCIELYTYLSIQQTDEWA